MRRALVAAAALAACSRSPGAGDGSAAPLTREALIGRWERLCKIDDPATTACRGRDPTGAHDVVYEADGTFRFKSDGMPEAQGRWSLEGDRLTIEVETGGMKGHGTDQVRLVDARLIEWSPERRAGWIYGRPDRAFSPPRGPVSDRAPVERRLDRIGYRLALPAGYRLASHQRDEERWEPITETGLVFEVAARPRGLVNYEVSPCPAAAGAQATGGEEREIDGAIRRVRADVDLCIDGTDLYLRCWVKHTRGYLEPADEAAGKAVCLTLALVR